jgi:hypothetical protein
MALAAERGWSKETSIRSGPIRMKKSFIYAAALGGLMAASIVGSPAYATTTTEDFTISDGATVDATGIVMYTPNSGIISAFSGFTGFSITFDKAPSTTYTYTYSELTSVPTIDTFVDFNTATGQFVEGDATSFYGEYTLLGADNAGNTIDFYIYNNNQGTGNNLYEVAQLGAGGVFNVPWGTITYSDPPTGVPEPWTVAVFGAGLVGLGVMVRRRKKKTA